MVQTIQQSANSDRPRAVTTAVRLLTASLAIGLVRAIFNLAQKTTGSSMILALLIVIAFFGLLFVLVMKISAGKNWARIIMLIIVAVLVLFLPFAIPAFLDELRKSVLGGVFSISITLLQLLGTYLLFTKPSNLWFRTRK